MEERKRKWWIDFCIILAMMTIVILLCHPIARNWSDDEIGRYIGEEGAYSPDVDSYYYLRKAKEYSEGGIRSIRLIAYRTEDTKCTTGDAIAREANGAMPQLLPISAALVWYALRSLGINVGIYALSLRFCSFLLSLFVIPVYLFLKKRTSRTAAVLGALLVSLEAPFFRHSHVGYFDTDALIGLLALVLILSLYDCFVARSRKKQAVYGVLSLLALILLRFTWTAFFIYGIISVGTVMLGVVAVRLRGKFDENQKRRLFIPAIVVVAIIGVSLVFGWNSFVSLAKGFVSTSTATEGGWPSETMNIAELEKVSLSDADSLWYHFLGIRQDITSVTGGLISLLFLVVSVGVCIAQLIKSLNSHPKEREKLFLYSAILSWMFGTVVLAFFGLRYMEFVTLPSAVVIGLGYDCVGRYLEKKTIDGRRVVFAVISIMVFCGLILLCPIEAVIASVIVMAVGWFFARAKRGNIPTKIMTAAILLPVMISCEVVCAQDTPYVERSMEDAMCWVKENTDQDAVLADFWNLGYIYQYYGERRCIADGGTYNGQFFYWLANMLMTDDPHLSAGIARMLQNCGIDGSEYAQKLMGSAVGARKMLKIVLPLTRADAEVKLREEYFLTEEQVNRLLDYTHPLSCPDIFFVLSHNTFERSSSLMAYPRWDESSSEGKDETMYSIEAVARPESGGVALCKVTLGGDFLAVVVVSAKEDELEGYIVTRNGTEVEYGREVFVQSGKVVYDRTVAEPSEGRTLLSDEALVLFEENGKVSAVTLDSDALDSVFIKLFLMNGEGQDVFEKVYDSSEIKGASMVYGRLADYSSVIIWRVKAE